MVSKGLKLQITGVTDVGLVRTHNEDTIGWDPRLGLAILADGMGGHNAGEVASDLAVNSIRAALADVLTPEVKESGIVNYFEAVRDAVGYANQEIHLQSRQRPECAGMGTTVVMTLFQDHQVIVAHVGDSRIYRYRDNALQQITQDHSLIQEMIDSGFITAEQAHTAGNKNLITRALGISEEVQVDVKEEATLLGDIFLLCSDGLSDMVPDPLMQGVLQEHYADMEMAGRTLIGLANERGGSDNISVILIKMSEAYSDERGLED